MQKMVNERVLVKKKWRRLRRILLVLILVFFVVLILLVVLLFGMFLGGDKIEIVVENPIKDIIFANTVEGVVNKEAVIKQAVLEFDEDYINYILVGLGVGNLHKSLIYGNPILEFSIDDESWNSKLIGAELSSKKGTIDVEDLRIIITRREAVEAILAEDIEKFMKDSVASGRTGIEMVAGKVELASKGYLAMYKDLTGEEIEVDVEEIEEIVDELPDNLSIEDFEIDLTVACLSDEDCAHDCSAGCLNKNFINSTEITCGVFCCKCINNECIQLEGSECGMI